jgi:hypothetical protein
MLNANALHSLLDVLPSAGTRLLPLNLRGVQHTSGILTSYPSRRATPWSLPPNARRQSFRISSRSP